MSYVTTDRTGIPYSSEPPRVIGPSGSGSSGSGSDASRFAQSIANEVQSHPSDWSEAVSNVYNLAQSNSAFNAEQASMARDWSAEQSQLAMAHSAAEAQKNRDWQENLSNTAHQREVSDLIAAGLNPVLSANHGATTPTGATGSGYTGSVTSASADSASNAIASLFSGMFGYAAQQSMLDKQLDLQYNQMIQNAENVRTQAGAQVQSSINAMNGNLGSAYIHAQSQERINEANRASNELIAQWSNENKIQTTGMQQEGETLREGMRQSGANERSTTGMINEFMDGVGAAFGMSGNSALYALGMYMGNEIQKQQRDHNPGEPITKDTVSPNGHW